MRLCITLIWLVALSAPAISWATPRCQSSYEDAHFEPHAELGVRPGTERLCGVKKAESLAKVEYGPAFTLDFAPDGVRARGFDAPTALQGHRYLVWEDEEMSGTPALVELDASGSYLDRFEDGAVVTLLRVEVLEVSSVEPVGDAAKSGAWCMELTQPIASFGSYLLLADAQDDEASQVVGRIQVHPGAPVYERRAPRFTQEPAQLYACGDYGLVVLKPVDVVTPRLYEWTIRDPDGALMTQDFGTQPYLLGMKNVEPRADLYKPGVTYRVEVRGLNPDGTTTEATVEAVEFRISPRRASGVGFFIGALAELLFPDFRLQFDGAMTASLPVGMTIWRTKRQDGCTTCARLAGYIEPQITLNDWTPRVFGYLRGQVAFDTARVHDILIPLEVGYLYGSDGHGPGVGLGIGAGIFERWSIEVVLRRYFLLDQDSRHDVALNVEFYPLDWI